MGKLFDGVRAAVSAEDAARRYGVLDGRGKMARCIWHEDKHPSLSFDRRTGRCRCCVCHNGGSAIDLVSQQFGLSLLDAARKINEDFRLGLDAKGTAPPIGENPLVVQRRERETAIRNANDRFSFAFLTLRDHADEMNMADEEEVAMQMARAADDLNNLTA